MENNIVLVQPRKTALFRTLPDVLAVLCASSFAMLVINSDQVWLAWMQVAFPDALLNLWGLFFRGHMLLDAAMNLIVILF